MWIWRILLALMLLGALELPAWSERRVALLVGNQRGWKGEEFLKHTLQGDLLPLQSALQRAGFRVIVLPNRGPAALRKTFAGLSKKKLDTFLFYYSGHAGPRYFHLGPRSQKPRPFGFGEFRDWFTHKLHSTRRIAIIDACFGARLLRSFRNKRLRIKGPRRIVKRDLIRALQPTQGQTRGLQLIVSSQVYAFEDRSRKASIFTYHLLQGIRGKKAADADQDGKITVSEIFRYAGRRFHRETGEEPSFFEYTIKRSTPYALVPAYNSGLRIDAGVAGKLLISVGNFSWAQYKPKGVAYRLKVVSGRAQIRLQRGRQCFVQQLKLPKGGEIRLPDRWRTESCKKRLSRKKGLLLDAQLAPPDGSSSRTRWKLSVAPGYLWQRSDVRESHLAALVVGLRWRDLLGLALFGSFGAPRNLGSSDFAALRIGQWGLLFELGGRLSLAPAWGLYLGGYSSLSALLQHAGESAVVTLALGAGGLAQLEWRLQPRFGLILTSRVGLQWHPVTQGHGFAFHLQTHLGVAISL